MSKLNIKAISERTGVTADTIRYYERIGLIPPVKRNQHGVRAFDEEDIRWLLFSRHMRQAGLSIEALIEYIRLFKDNDPTTVPARVDILTSEREALQERINVLQRASERLEFKINNYDSHMVPAEQKLRPFEMNK